MSAGMEDVTESICLHDSVVTLGLESERGRQHCLMLVRASSSCCSAMMAGLEMICRDSSQVGARNGHGGRTEVLGSSHGIKEHQKALKSITATARKLGVFMSSIQDARDYLLPYTTAAELSLQASQSQAKWEHTQSSAAQTPQPECCKLSCLAVSCTHPNLCE